MTFYQTHGDDKSLEERLMSPAIITDRGKVFLGLQKKDGKCIFLEDNKCQIYESRPQICRCFPYTFQIRGDHIYWGYSLKAKEYCPTLLEADEINTATLEELASQILKESEEFKKLIYVWNNLAQKNLVEPTPHMLLLFITGKLQLNLEESVQD